jgi:hypothetical protein
MFVVDDADEDEEDDEKTLKCLQSIKKMRDNKIKRRSLQRNISLDFDGDVYYYCRENEFRAEATQRDGPLMRSNH